MQPDTSENLDMRRAKILLNIALAIMVGCIVTAFYFSLQLEHKKQELLEKKNELEHAQDSILGINVALERAQDSIIDLQEALRIRAFTKDTAVFPQISLNPKSTNNSIFSQAEGSRKLALQQLLDHDLNDPATVKQMIAFGIDNITDVKGTVNVLYYLNKNNPKILLQFRPELTNYLNLVDKQTGRQQAKNLSSEIRKKITDNLLH